MLKRTLAARIPFLALVLLLLVPASFVQADSVQVQAKTTPPPTEFTLLTVFDPDYLYLENGHAYIFNDGDEKVKIAGESSGTIRVDEIGVQVTLQRWTGIAWIDVFFGSSITDSDAAYVYSSYSNVSVESGYYYRAKAYHWIVEGAVSESGYRYSNTFLVP